MAYNVAMVNGTEMDAISSDFRPHTRYGGQWPLSKQIFVAALQVVVMPIVLKIPSIMTRVDRWADGGRRMADGGRRS